VARPEGSERRHLFLSRFDEHVSVDGEVHPLSMARYPGLWAPAGSQALESFALAPYPSALYRVGEATIRRELMMVEGQPTVLVRYALEHGIE
jgi:glycogen debranching enzyme